jgi:hypothetical protein
MEPIDIRRSAKILVHQYGLFAPQERRQRADELAAKGDTDGEAVWEAIRRDAEGLLENWPPQDLPGLPS